MEELSASKLTLKAKVADLEEANEKLTEQNERMIGMVVKLEMENEKLMARIAELEYQKNLLAGELAPDVDSESSQESIVFRMGAVNVKGKGY